MTDQQNNVTPINEAAAQSQPPAQVPGERKQVTVDVDLSVDMQEAMSVALQEKHLLLMQQQKLLKAVYERDQTIEQQKTEITKLKTDIAGLQMTLGAAQGTNAPQEFVPVNS